MLINYVGGNGTFPEVSFASLGKDPSVADKLRGRIVLVGETAQGSGDRLFTPLSAGIGMAGVEIHANILSTMLDGAYLRARERIEGRLGNARDHPGNAVGMVRGCAASRQIAWLAGLGAFTLAAPYGQFLQGAVWPAFSLLAAFGCRAGDRRGLAVARCGQARRPVRNPQAAVAAAL